MKLISLSPQKLFLIDGVGALLSAIMLGVVLVRFESFFGIPETALYLLAILPLAFAVFDGFAYFSPIARQHQFLKVIAMANLGYCLLSIVMAWQHSASITFWGWAYLIGEIAIVLGLAHLEWHAPIK